MKNEESGPRPARRRFNFNYNPAAPGPAPRDYERPAPGPAAGPVPSRAAGRKPPPPDKTGPLIFNVSTLLREPEGSRREYDFEQDSLPLAQAAGEKPDTATNVRGHVRFSKVRHEILTQGRGEADVVLECVRCLREFDYYVEFELEEVFRPSIDILSGMPVKAASLDEEADLKIDANHLLNLGEAIRQQILVNLPIKPVCGDDCPGYSSILDRINSRSTIPDPPDEPDPVARPEPEAGPPSGPVDKRWSALSRLIKDEDDS